MLYWAVKHNDIFNVKKMGNGINSGTTGQNIQHFNYVSLSVPPHIVTVMHAKLIICIANLLCFISFVFLCLP